MSPYLNRIGRRFGILASGNFVDLRVMWERCDVRREKEATDKGSHRIPRDYETLFFDLRKSDFVIWRREIMIRDHEVHFGDIRTVYGNKVGDFSIRQIV
ncbi:unnamed protein product [Microthlaspi erraticum]|uniref:Uncharacterized protein n=1 Tax=Microthlaspi erraticum TaxID=1685480 RepID=A0A6D2L9R2_9BRAS|nr:unnamed protein product [Microthlaspi erraticum]